jgi:capsular polysaccharide export protein
MTNPMTRERRSFLFLQGMASKFFARLGQALAAKGHEVHRINFNGGDRLFWLQAGAADFRASLNRWIPFLEASVTDWNVTDVILFGDCRPHHREAIRFASLRGIRVHVFDEGYVRPNCITLEEGGVNANSALARDPDWFLSAAADAPEWDGGIPVLGNFPRRATEDVLYNLASALLAPLYPGYRTHRPWHPFVEYGGWLRKFARKPFARRRIARALAEIENLHAPYYIFPLQLDCDSQIRQHSGFGRVAPSIAHVLDSFRNHAPADAFLVVKEHPLDNALTDWRKMTGRLAAKMGIADRVIYIEGGSLDLMLSRSAGTVTVNSTTGFLAIAFGRPTIALGHAIYDMPGLTFQGGLDAFWRAGTPPDPALFDAFRRVTVAKSQVNGGFFSREGLELAISGSVKRLETPHSAPVFALVPNNAGSASDISSIATTA